MALFKMVEKCMYDSIGSLHFTFKVFTFKPKRQKQNLFFCSFNMTSLKYDVASLRL